MADLTVIVPVLPPTVNHMYALNRDGSKRLTDEAQSFRAYVVAEARSTARLTGWRLPAGALEFEIKLTYGTKHRTDIDNRVKAALDAIAIAFDFDDTRIERIVIERAGIDPKRPLTEMIVRQR